MRGSMVAFVAGVALCLGAAFAVGAFGEDRETVEATSFYGDWPLDEDGNGLHDVLDERLASGATGPVVVELHYAHHPTDEDVDRVHETARVYDLYRYDNWEDLLVRTEYEDLTALADLDAVLGVEHVPKATTELQTSARTIRALPADVVADGIDHTQAVHDTLGYEGQGTVVAILDTGVDNTHASLDDLDDDPSTMDPKLVTKQGSDGGVLAGGAEVTNNLEAVGCVDPPDTFSHGTHVASIALGTGGEAGPVGVAPQAKMVDVGLSGVSAFGTSGTPIGLDWILSFNRGETCYGDPGPDSIDVVQMSLSLNSTDPDASINRKVTDLVQDGMTFVASAGNAGPGVSTLTKGSEGAIYVASSDDEDTVDRSDDATAGSSSRGPRTTDRDADRLDELRPDVAAPGAAIEAALAGSREGTVSLSGTSMAAPHVSGTAALILEANPELAPVDRGRNQAMDDPGAVPVRDLLIETAQPKTDTDGPAPQLAQEGRFGLPWNNAWGYGLLDSFAAVEQAPSYEPVALPPLLANATADDGLALAGEPTTLVGQAAGGQPGYSFAWTLPDGTTATGPEVEHAFEEPGTADVAIEVTDSADQTASNEIAIDVFAPPMEPRAILDDAYDRTDDGVWLVDPTEHVGERLDGRVILEDGDGRPLEGVPFAYSMYYQGVPDGVSVGSSQGHNMTDEDGRAPFDIDQELAGMFIRGPPPVTSLPGHHEVRFHFGQPLDETLTLTYWVGPGAPS